MVWTSHALPTGACLAPTHQSTSMRCLQGPGPPHMLAVSLIKTLVLGRNEANRFVVIQSSVFVLAGRSGLRGICLRWAYSLQNGKWGVRGLPIGPEDFMRPVRLEVVWDRPIYLFKFDVSIFTSSVLYIEVGHSKANSDNDTAIHLP